MFGVQTFAHHFEAKNNDGVTIYYAYTNNNSNSSTVYVTFRGSTYTASSGEYRNDVVIPETVTYNGKTYKVTSIRSYAFYDCSGLTSVTIPKSVTSIGERAFNGCSGLTSVTISEGVTSIGERAFAGCKALVSLTIPNSVTSISDYAFLDCSGLKRMRVSDNVEVINETIFNSCNFETLILGKKTCYIDINSLSASKFLMVYAEIPPKIISSNGTIKVQNTALILVPYNKLEEYKHEWIDYYPSYLGYKYLPIVDADICFYDQATLQDYLVETEKYDMDTITSVAFYNGKDDYLTDKWLRTGMNPNCLFYVYPDDIMTGDNVVNISNSTAENIVLQDGYSFRCPTAFNAKNILYSYTPNVWADGKKGWDALCLPFRVSQFKASTKGSISPILLGANGDFWLRKFVGASSEELYFTSTYDGIMEANTPYIVAFPGKGMGSGNLEGQSISFIGKDIEVGVSEEKEIQRNEYIFKANYNTAADGHTGWVLNSAGDGFDESQTVGNKPFRAYFYTDDGNAAGAKSLCIGYIGDEEMTAIDELLMEKESIKVNADGSVEVVSSKDGVINVFGVNGTLVCSQKVTKGINYIGGLPKGLYIINKQKIIIP